MRSTAFRISGIIMIFLLMSCFGLSACSENGTTPALKVLIIHSYHEDWSWDQDVQRGIMEGLSRKGYVEDQDYEIKTFYMDTKVTYTATEQIEQRAETAIGLIKKFGPDIVFVNDDNALKYVAVRYVERYPDGQLPFVFCGINTNPSDYTPIQSLDVPGGSITGLLERFPYFEAFSLGKRMLPDASKIVLLADPSPSSTFVINAFQERYVDTTVNSPLQIIGPFQLSTFDEWKAKVTQYQAEADFLGIMTYHQLRDENGNIVPASQVVDWTVHNSMLPEIGFLTFHAEDGFLAAAGVSGEDTGIYAGVIGGEIIGGANPGTIPIVDPGVVYIALNLAREEMLEISIPAAELASADEVFHSIGSPD